MEIEKILVGDTVLAGYRSETVDGQLMLLRGTASFTLQPEETRALIELVIGELARASGGDFLDGYFTIPQHVARTTPKKTTDRQFLHFEANVEKLYEWAQKSRGKHWSAVERAVEQGGMTPLEAVRALMAKKN